MAKQPKGGHLVPHLARRERGTALTVHTRRETLPDGTIGAVGFIDMSNAEVPERSYLAEACGARYQKETVSILFAQPKLDSGLRSMALVSMTPLATAQFVQSIESMRDPSLQEMSKQLKIEPERLIDFPTTEPEQTASLIANVVAVAVSGRDSCMDFYHANAFSYLHLKTNNHMYLEPVVRVNLRTSLLLALMPCLKEFQTNFPPDAALWEEKP